MSRYNTQNPIESDDVRDMSDNAKNLDLLSNSSGMTFDDRFGVERKTIHGMNSEFDSNLASMNSEFDSNLASMNSEFDSNLASMNSEFDSNLASMNSEFDSQILNMGFTRIGTFASGATLTNPRQTLLWDIADGGDGQEYGWSGTFAPHGKIVPPSSSPTSTGGIAIGAWVSRFDPLAKTQIREALRRSYAEAGYNLVSGSFEAGGTVSSATDVLLFEADGHAYRWGGVLPKVVAAGSTPTPLGSGGWIDRSEYLRMLTVNVTDPRFAGGADPAGAVSAVAAFQSAINYLLSAGGGALFIPRGTYWFPAGAKLNPGEGGIAFTGEGMDASILHYHEGTTQPASNGVDHLFKNIDNVAKKALLFKGLQFKGTLNETTRASRWANPLWLDYYPGIYITECKFIDIAGEAMDFHKCGRFVFTDNYLENIAGDGIRARDTPNCIVTNNTVLRNGDDAIALHTSDSFAPTREGVIVANNRLVNCGAIKVLGGRVVSITGNHLELPNLWGIVVDNQAGVEGNQTLRDINITGNTILDVLSIASGTPGTSQTGIEITGVIPRGTALTNGTIPGNYNSTAGAFTFPWNYDELEVDDAANPVGYIRGVNVSNNIVRRSRPAVPAFTDYGFGKRLWQGVPYNPAITNAHLRMNDGIRFSGGFHNVRVLGNALESCVIGIELVAPTMHRQYLGFIISKNVLFDCRSRGVLVNSGAFTQDITIEGNHIDCDPYRQNSNSSINGTYLADSLPRGIESGGVSGLKIVNNKFRNVCRALATNSSSAIYLSDNVLSCQPVATAIGFNVANKGIGVLDAASGAWLYEVIDADPTSTTYGAITNMQVTDRAGVPSTGTFVTGAYVRNTAPVLDGNNMIVLGWLRITTGTAHVLGTDWAVVRASHVSPAT